MPALKRKLHLWETMAFSLGLMAPMLAITSTRRTPGLSHGARLPLAFLVGFVAATLAAYALIRLTQRFGHAGGAYALIGAALGPRTGFVAGFSLCAAYLFLAVATSAFFGAMFNALLESLGGDGSSVSFAVPALVCLCWSALLNMGDTLALGRFMLVIEAVGITAMIVLTVGILSQGGADRTGLGLEAFHASSLDSSSLRTAVCVAFLSWTGFEACSTLGEEVARPRRTIPRALFGSILLTGAVLVTLTYVETVGFGTDAHRVAAFQASSNTLPALAETYVSHWFAVLLLVVAALSGFIANLAAVAAGSRLWMALARHGFGPRPLSRLAAGVNLGYFPPRAAVIGLVASALAIVLASWSLGPPELGAGNAAIDATLFFATAGTQCLLFVYLLAAVAVFAAERRGVLRTGSLGLVITTLGAVCVLLILWRVASELANGFATALSLTALAIGILVAATAGRLIQRVRDGLAEELALNRSRERPSWHRTRP